MSVANPLDTVLSGLMTRYRDRVPAVDQVLNALITRGAIASADDISNDHIAFRTIGVPQLGISSLERVFLHYGYEKRDPFRFEVKKLNAFWYAPPEPCYPRIFMSELCVDELSESAQSTIRKYTDTVPNDPVDELDLNDGAAVDAFLHTSLWEMLTWDEYSSLLDESEYAAWAMYNRYYLNHYTVSVHDLPEGLNTLEAFNTFLDETGITLNNSGGTIKTSADGKLKQSSSVAQIVSADFRTADGTTQQHEIAGSYVEFAERLPLDEFADLPADQVKREHRRDGFETGNADRIFESTFKEQTSRSN